MWHVLKKTIAAALLVVFASSAFAAWPNTPIIKWNPQAYGDYTDDPMSACVIAADYFGLGPGGNYCGPTTCIADYTLPRPGYETVQHMCYAHSGSNPPSWLSVILLMGSCDGGKTYNQAVTACSCPVNSTLVNGNCVCDVGYVDNPTGNRTCSRLVIQVDASHSKETPLICPDPNRVPSNRVP